MEMLTLSNKLIDIQNEHRMMSESNVGYWNNECPVLKNKQVCGKNKNSVHFHLTNRLPQAPAVCCTEDLSVMKGNCVKIKCKPFVFQGCV